MDTESVGASLSNHIAHVLRAAGREGRDELRLVGAVVRVALLGGGVRVTIADTVVTRAEDERDAASAELGKLLADTDCVTLGH